MCLGALGAKYEGLAILTLCSADAGFASRIIVIAIPQCSNDIQVLEMSAILVDSRVQCITHVEEKQPDARSRASADIIASPATAEFEKACERLWPRQPNATSLTQPSRPNIAPILRGKSIASLHQRTIFCAERPLQSYSTMAAVRLYMERGCSRQRRISSILNTAFIQAAIT